MTYEETHPKMKQNFRSHLATVCAKVNKCVRDTRAFVHTEIRMPFYFIWR